MWQLKTQRDRKQTWKNKQQKTHSWNWTTDVAVMRYTAYPVGYQGASIHNFLHSITGSYESTICIMILTKHLDKSVSSFHHSASYCSVQVCTLAIYGQGIFSLLCCAEWTLSTVYNYLGNIGSVLHHTMKHGKALYIYNKILPSASCWKLGGKVNKNRLF